MLISSSSKFYIFHKLFSETANTHTHIHAHGPKSLNYRIDLGFECHSPRKGIRAPWSNVGYRTGVKIYKMSLKYLVVPESKGVLKQQ